MEYLRFQACGVLEGILMGTHGVQRKEYAEGKWGILYFYKGDNPFFICTHAERNKMYD